MFTSASLIKGTQLIVIRQYKCVESEKAGWQAKQNKQLELINIMIKPNNESGKWGILNLEK